MLLYRLLYRSELRIPGSEGDVRAEMAGIVQASRKTNARTGLTGALVHAHGAAVQVLEGSMEAVEATFERICCDLRHSRVELLELVPATERVFSEWEMAQVTADLRLSRTLADLEVQATDKGAPSTQTVVDLMRSTLMGQDCRAT